MTPSSVGSRRHPLRSAPTPARRRSRARLATLALTTSVGLLGPLLGLVATGTAPAQAVTPDTGPTSRQAAFAAAAHEFGVPTSVLEAVSYAETRWEGHAGGHSTDGGYGPMNLVDGTLFAADQAEGKDGADGSSPGTVPTVVDTLGRAAALLGLDRQALRTSDVANIRGGAALLAREQKALGLPTGSASDPGQWYAAVADAAHASTRRTRPASPTRRTASSPRAGAPGRPTARPGRCRPRAGEPQEGRAGPARPAPAGGPTAWSARAPAPASGCRRRTSSRPRRRRLRQPRPSDRPATAEDHDTSSSTTPRQLGTRP